RPPWRGSSGSDRLAARDIVLFVNPIPEKGVHLAAELAACLPDQQFVFVEGWRPIGAETRSLPSNVTVLPRRPSLDYLYCRARLLLVPSTIPDACPRVVGEAGLRGVPALGSDVGGIPELIADVRNLLPATSPRRWRERADALLDDPDTWRLASVEQRR